jgi:hypothetical protein
MAPPKTPPVTVSATVVDSGDNLAEVRATSARGDMRDQETLVVDTVLTVPLAGHHHTPPLCTPVCGSPYTPEPAPRSSTKTLVSSLGCVP